jgi:hypothetical protein
MLAAVRAVKRNSVQFGKSQRIADLMMFHCEHRAVAAPAEGKCRSVKAVAQLQQTAVCVAPFVK